MSVLNILKFISLLYLFSSTLFGGLNGAINGRCPTDSIQSYINIPYRLACEFVQPRWEKK